LNLTRRSSRYRLHFGSSGPEKQKTADTPLRCVVRWLNSCRLANRLEHTTQVSSPVLWVKCRVAGDTSATFPTSRRGNGYLGKRRYRSSRTLSRTFAASAREGILRAESDRIQLFDTLSSWLWTYIEHYLGNGRSPGEGHLESPAAVPRLRSDGLANLKPRMMDGHYRRERKVLFRRNRR